MINRLLLFCLPQVGGNAKIILLKGGSGLRLLLYRRLIRICRLHKRLLAGHIACSVSLLRVGRGVRLGNIHLRYAAGPAGCREERGGILLIIHGRHLRRFKAGHTRLR